MILSIVTGSVVMEGTATSETISIDDASASLSSGLSGLDNIDGLPLTSSSITVNSDSTAAGDTERVGMIIGIVTGSLAAIGTYVII